MTLRIQIEAQRDRYERQQRKSAGQLALEKAPQWKRKPPMMQERTR